MVRAILDGRKTVTRRIVKPHPPKSTVFRGFVKTSGNKALEGCGVFSYGDVTAEYVKAPCQVGDILYVRETFFQYGEWMEQRIQVSEDEYKTKHFFAPKGNKEIYFTDNLPKDIKILRGYKSGRGYYKRPSLFMPKEAARIFLRVTDIRVERLQEITEEQAEHEGIIDNCKSCKCKNNFSECDVCVTQNDVINDFAYLWNSTIKKQDIDKYGWNANPFVWVYEFERISNLREAMKEGLQEAAQYATP